MGWSNLRDYVMGVMLRWIYFVVAESQFESTFLTHLTYKQTYGLIVCLKKNFCFKLVALPNKKICNPP